MISELGHILILIFGIMCGALFMFAKLSWKVQDSWKDAEACMRRHRTYADSVVEENKRLQAELVKAQAEVERLERIEARHLYALASRRPPFKK